MFLKSLQLMTTFLCIRHGLDFFSGQLISCLRTHFLWINPPLKISICWIFGSILSIRYEAGLDLFSVLELYNSPAVALAPKSFPQTPRLPPPMNTGINILIDPHTHSISSVLFLKLQIMGQGLLSLQHTMYTLGFGYFECSAFIGSGLRQIFI